MVWLRSFHYPLMIWLRNLKMMTIKRIIIIKFNNLCVVQMSSLTLISNQDKKFLGIFWQ